VLDLTIPPATAEVERLIEAVEAFAEEAGLPPKATHRLTLVVEELAVNIATHGSVGEGAATFVAVSLRRQGDEVTLTLEDDGRPFDPLARAAPDTGAALEDREIGGLGVHFVKQVSRSVAYRREAGRNRLTAVIDATA
jgi:serine/threonine-protein kinase RsbW